MTWYGKQMHGKNIALYLPNGYIEKSEQSYRMVISSRTVNSPSVYTALRVIDYFASQNFYTSWQELQKALVFEIENATRFLTPFGSTYNKLRFLTLTKSPDADPESTTVDGRITKTGPSDWATITTGSGGAAQDAAGNTACPLLTASASGSTWDEMARGWFLFDTSALGGEAIIDSAKIRIYVSAVAETLASQSVRIVTSSPASNTALATTDYTSNIGSTAQATDRTIAGLSTAAYNDFTLNATGITNVSKTSISKFGIRLVSDADNSEPSWSASASASSTIDFADATNDPQIQVEYRTGGNYAFFM